ncbi:hypothetical protein [Aureivirga sp. CE67]|uniref:hypothetical protein n=1 Tax=Aureivirga sp. CE67 TaxID=1788983 RepID=UPI0018CB449B|nr:hypothetical protein [Aureivirga sp. CE67]
MNTKFESGNKKCDIEIFTNLDGIVIKFHDLSKEPKPGQIVDYVYVDSGYGYISFKIKNEDAIISGLLKREFFSDEKIIYDAIEFTKKNVPSHFDAFIPYNLEILIVSDTSIYTGE